jgi:ceramide glucosyltransferase
MILTDIPSILLGLLILSGSIYQAFSVFCVADFFPRKGSSGSPRRFPPVSILKPVKGRDPGFSQNLASFCSQDYPVFEVLVGFSDADARDAAEALKEVTQAGLGGVQVVVSSRNLGANRKISNLQGLADVARHPLFAISDSDMRVDRFYLRDIVREYYDGKKVGMVTSLYKISDVCSLGSALESLTVALDFIPAVVVARRLEGVTFGLGASMLVSRKGIEEIGGLGAVADYLADDYQLGNRLWKKGYTVILSRTVIETVVGHMTIRDFINHQIRWARTYRASRPKGFFGYGITYIVPYAVLLTVVSGPGAFTLSVLGAALGLRFSLAAVVSNKVIRSRAWLKWLPLLPLKDLAGFGIWIWSFVSSTVQWRGRSYRIGEDGRMVEEQRNSRFRSAAP